MMNKEILRRTAKKILASYSSSERKSLSQVKTKRTAIRMAYRMVSDLIKGYHYDSSWLGVKKVLDTLREGGFDVESWVNDGGYSPDGAYKKYELKLEFENEFGHKFHISGNMICSFQEKGNFDTPYDISLILY